MIQMNLFTEQKWIHRHSLKRAMVEKDKLRVWDTIACKIDQQQGSIV